MTIRNVRISPKYTVCDDLGQVRFCMSQRAAAEYVLAHGYTDEEFDDEPRDPMTRSAILSKLRKPNASIVLYDPATESHDWVCRLERHDTAVACE